MPIGDPRNQLPHCTVCGELDAPLDARGLCDPCAAAAVVDQLHGERHA